MDPERLRRLFGLLRAAFATVIVDTSKGLQASDFMAFEMSDLILVVVQLDMICLRNTARLLSLFREYEGMADRVKLVANRAGSFPWEISQKKAEETLKMPITWQIPNAAKTFQGDSHRKVRRSRKWPRVAAAHQVFLEMARSLRPPVAKRPHEAPAGPVRRFFLKERRTRSRER